MANLSRDLEDKNFGNKMQKKINNDGCIGKQQVLQD